MRIAPIRSLTLVLALVASTFSAVVVSSAASAAATDVCDGSYSYNDIRATATHSKVFYIDSGQGQNVDASYVGYQINTSAAKSNIWAKLDTFSGGVVSLANPADSAIPLGDISSETKTAFFLLKAPTNTSGAQSHMLRIYSGKPGLTSSTELYSCKFTFTKVAETIKALANKVQDISTSTSSYVLGNTMTITVEGDTGQIGSGNAIDGDMIWVSPVSRSSWPTSALRLVGTNLKFWNNSSRNQNSFEGEYIDTLRVKDLRSLDTRLYYTAVYTFKIIGQATSAASIAPVAQISSGTQVKHNDMSRLPSSAISSASISINATISKAVASAITQSSGKTQLSYTITLNNASASAVIFDQVVDSPSNLLTYLAGSVRLAGSATAEPSFDSNGKLVFSQPISVNANSSKTLTYTMIEKNACTLSGSFSYQNSATASIGSITLGSGPATYSLATAAGICGNSTLDTATTVNQALPIEVTTLPATSIANTSAAINGTVDANANSGQAIYFEWGTDPNLSTFTSENVGTTTSSSAPSASSKSLNGLSSGTVYYYRIRVGDVYGEILSFVTTQPVSTPTASTDPATSVSQTNATLNGTVDPNQTPVTVEMQVWRTGTDTVTVLLTDDPSQPYDSREAQASYNPYLQLSGSFPTAVSINLTDPHYGLTSFIGSGNTVYYRVRLKNVSTNAYIYAPEIRQFTLTTYFPQEITFNPISDITYGDNAPAISPASDIFGSNITYGSATPEFCTVSSAGVITILKVGICTITADHPGGLNQADSRYYEPATQKTQSFVISPKAITITADAKSKEYGSSDPTLTSSITAGALVGSDTITGTLSRAAGEGVGTYLISRGVSLQEVITQLHTSPQT